MISFLVALPYLIIIFAIVSIIFAAVELLLKTKGICGIFSGLCIVASIFFGIVADIGTLNIMLITMVYTAILAILLYVKKKKGDKNAV